MERTQHPGDEIPEENQVERKVTDLMQRVLANCPPELQPYLTVPASALALMEKLHALHGKGGRYTAEILRKAQDKTDTDFYSDPDSGERVGRLDDHMIQFEQKWDLKRPTGYRCPLFDIQWAFLVGYDLSRFVSFVLEKLSNSSALTPRRVADYQTIHALLFFYGFTPQKPEQCVFDGMHPLQVVFADLFVTHRTLLDFVNRLIREKEMLAQESA